MTDIITHSSLRTLGECFRKYWYVYDQQIRPVDEPEYFRIGGAFHAGIEALGTDNDLARACGVVRARYEDLLTQAKSPEHLDALELESEKVVRLLAGWHWRWSDDAIQVIETEVPFQLPILSPKGAPARAHQFAGVRDRLVRDGDGHLLVQEFKTASDDIQNPDYWLHLRMDSQISGYYRSYAEAGHDVYGVLYDVIRKPSIRPKRPIKSDLAQWPMYYGQEFSGEPPDTETAAMYGARLTADLMDRPEFYFGRRVIARLESDMSEFQADLWQKHVQIREARAAGHWPRQTRSCFLMGRCPYFDLCAHGYDPNDSEEQLRGRGFKRIDDPHPELSRQTQETQS